MSNEPESFLGENEPEKKVSVEEQAFEKRQKAKAEKHDKVTRDLTTVSRTYPQAYQIFQDYIDFEIYTFSMMISSANDSDILLKYSGALKVLNEIKEKLNLYNEFT